MTEPSDEPTTGISDDQLPDDLVPSDDNPLAQGLEDGETVGDLFEDGKRAEQDPDADDDTAETGGSEPGDD